MHHYIEKHKGTILLTAGVILFCSSFLVWWMVLEKEGDKTLTVSFLDVGQGDAIFITTPSGRQVLVDGGRNSKVLQELNSVMPFWDRSIDIVIATHPDADHIRGLIEVFKRFDVTTFVHSGVEHDTEEAEALRTAVINEQSNDILARRGQVYDFGDGTRITILFPDRDVSGMESNAASVIAKVVFGEHSFLLTGDSPKMIEEYLLSLSTEDVQSTVLKAGHHGSKTSSSPLFVGFVEPQYVVLSRGCSNSYGHPHQEVLDTFTSFEIQTLDTCIDGRVTFTSDGQILRAQ